jgi:mono/diheme cytochrome c family protein
VVVSETVEVTATEAAPVAAEAAPAIVESEPVDIEKGKAIYLSACIKCHNKDPNVKGPIGPEIVDAPLEVMQHKVATGRYPDVLPEGFVPKRKTKQMTKFPQYLKDVPSIHAYVQSLKKK